MNSMSRTIITCATAWLLCQVAAPAFAQESPIDRVEAWRALDEDFTEAIVEEISARRGLDASTQSPDTLIRSAEDIAEALRVSCDLSGACADESGRATLGENLISFPNYDEEQGLRNAEAILRTRMGHEN